MKFLAKKISLEHLLSTQLQMQRDYGHMAKMHEYAVFYAKNITFTKTYLLDCEEKNFKFKDKMVGLISTHYIIVMKLLHHSIDQIYIILFYIGQK